jgi:hypothetical protein
MSFARMLEEPAVTEKGASKVSAVYTSGTADGGGTVPHCSVTLRLRGGFGGGVVSRVSQGSGGRVM